MRRSAVWAVLLGMACGGGITPSLAGADRGRLELPLDGLWDIAFDHRNEGRGADWHRDGVFSGLAAKREIRVPSCWEEIEKDYEGVAYYRKKFTVPKEWEGKVVRLRFEAVNFLSEVWLNDGAVGVHEGGFTPFEFRVEKLLQPGEENVLTLRVAGPILMTDKVIEGIGKMETPQWRGAITGGIWQPARLIASGDAYVDDVFIEPKIADDSATFHCEIQHDAEKAREAAVEIRVHPAGKPGEIVASKRESVRLKPGRNRLDWRLEIPNAAHWSPDNPHLYEAEADVAFDGEASDRWATRFGMREFTIRDKKFHLNGKPIFLKATFFEGLYPVRLAYPDSREMAAREIQLAKDAGFNMIRPWRKPPPPMWLDLADEMGVLTVGSVAIECMDFPIESARLPGWVANEIRQSVLRDRNRACVVQWELFNELKRPVLMQQLRPMAMLARELDPTRLILDESGGWAQGANMYLPYESEPMKFNDIHDYPGQQINDGVYEKLRLTATKTHDEMKKMGLGGRMPGKNVVVGLMTFFSELGYGSLPDLVDNNARFAKQGNPIVPPTVYHRRLADQHLRVLKESGFDKIYPDLEKFCLDQQWTHGVANRRMIEAVRCNPNVAGYCIHALTAGDWIMGAGLLDLWRNPKTYAYEGTKAASQPRILSIRVRPRNVYAAQGTKITVTGVNEREALAGNLKVLVAAGDGSTVLEKSAKVDLGPGITELFTQALDTKGLKGTYTVRATLSAADGVAICENEYGFDVFPAEALVAPTQRVAILEPAPSLKRFLKEQGIDVVAFDAQTDPSVPVFVSNLDAKPPMLKKHSPGLENFMMSGGTAIYLQAGGMQIPWGAPVKASAPLPFEARLRLPADTWIGVPRLVKAHPVFDGLPINGMMGAIYENVFAQSSLLDVPGEAIAASIGFDWFPDFDRLRRHYYGPGDAWWGTDLGVVPVGKGRCIVSRLRLIENLGKDPVADRILFNLIRFAAAP